MGDDAQTERTLPVADHESASQLTTAYGHIDRQALAAAEQQVGAEWQVDDVLLDLYEVTGLLGEGGMGRVYKAHHRGWNVDLAVKSPRPEIFATAGGKENFVREAETWVNLGLHPHTVSCYYVRTLGGIPRVFAEYVEGGSLADWIRTKKLYEGGPEKALERILDIAIQFAWGLHYAHEQGLVHQDVKPANVMMTADGVAKVTDFGLAKARGMAGEAQAAAGGEPAGAGAAAAAAGRSILVSFGGMTPAYCSPEQARGEPLSRKTDIWSWGLSVLEMFTGEVTWLAGQAAPGALQSYTEGPAPDGVPKMPQPLLAVLQRCFHDDPARRPESLSAVAEEVRGIVAAVLAVNYGRESPRAAGATPDTLNNHAASLLDLGRFEEAYLLWSQALELQPLHLQAAYGRALACWRAGQIRDEELIKTMEELCAGHHGNWLPEFLFGRALMERGDYKRAIEHFRRIPGSDAERPEVQEAMRAASGQETESRRELDFGYLAHTPWEEGDRRVDYRVTALALSPKGTFALSGGNDCNVSAWRLGTRNGRLFKGHEGTVTAICVGSDDGYALSASTDKTIRLWDLATGECCRVLEGHTADVEAVSLSADGRYALSGGADHTVKLWDVPAGRCVRTFEGHQHGVHLVSLSSDARTALSASIRDGALRIWDVATGRCLRVVEEKDVKAFDHSGRFVLLESEPEVLRVWDLESDRYSAPMPTSYHDTRHVYGDQQFGAFALSPSGLYVLAGGSGAEVDLLEAATGRCICTLSPRQESCSVSSVCFGADGHDALSGDAEGAVSWWRVDASRMPDPAPLALSRISSSVSVISGETLFRRGMDGAGQELAEGRAAEAAHHIREARSNPAYSRNPEALSAWTTLYLRLPRRGLAGAWEGLTFSGHTDWVNAMSLSDDGKQALSCTGNAYTWSHENSVKHWDIATGKCLRTLAHPSAVEEAIFASQGQHAVTATSEGTVRVWDLATGQCLHKIAANVGDSKHSQRKLAVTPDGRYAISATLYSTRVWEVKTGRCIKSFSKPAFPPDAVAPGGRFALSRCEGNTLLLWDLASGRMVRTFEKAELRPGSSAAVTSVCFSLDGRYALSGHRNEGSETLRLWDIASGKCLRVLQGEQYMSEPSIRECHVYAVALTADGRYALSGSGLFKVKLWELSSGHCLRGFEGHKDEVTSVAFAPDGRYALSASRDSTLKQWMLDWELDDRQPADWDDGARSCLETFLSLQTPRPTGLQTLASVITGRPKPAWSERDFERLLYTLGCAGYGWLRPEGVRRKLEKMAANWQGPRPLPNEAKSAR